MQGQDPCLTSTSDQVCTLCCMVTGYQYFAFQFIVSTPSPSRILLMSYSEYQNEITVLTTPSKLHSITNNCDTVPHTPSVFQVMSISQGHGCLAAAKTFLAPPLPNSLTAKSWITVGTWIKHDGIHYYSILGFQQAWWALPPKPKALNTIGISLFWRS